MERKPESERPRERCRSRWWGGLILKLGCEVISCIQLAQDSIKWRTLVIRVMQLTFHTRCQRITVSAATRPCRKQWLLTAYALLQYRGRSCWICGGRSDPASHCSPNDVSVAYQFSLNQYSIYTGMHRITTFLSTTDLIYDGGPLRL